MESIAPGVWRVRCGEVERFTPVSVLRPAAAEFPEDSTRPIEAPFELTAGTFATSPRGCTLQIPTIEGEQFFGLGLQLKSVNHTRRKRMLRVNSDPLADTGDSHAPVPFFVSTRGWGIFIDTARYVSVYLAAHYTPGQAHAQPGAPGRNILIDVPVARGIDVYLFAGPSLRDAVRRYVMFSGGGCLPAIWGLGVWYRAHGDSTQDDVLRLAESFRERHMPCDVLGLEPGWQSKAYSCSFVWNSARYPDPPALLSRLSALGYNVNLWEHAFTHPTSPLFEPLKPYSGDWLVWDGLVPDFSTDQARRIFADYHEKNLVHKGVTGFKLDECDNSDFVSSSWSFPESARFPSGLDGEQMHSLFGLLYQRTIHDIFRRNNLRTLSQVRCSHALAAPYPFVLYSDLYDHRDFVRGVVNAGFAGLLWSPEVREGRSVEDLLRRIQSVVLSPQALVNAWYIRNPPWLQVDKELNNAGQFMDDRDEVESIVRKLFELRMSLVPYLYAAFARYRFHGLPPVRAMVMDWPDDPATHRTDDQWLLGESLLVAPMFAGQAARDVYLPAGEWFDLHTGRKFIGGHSHRIEAALETVPVFVRGGSILPLAEPVQSVRPDTLFRITAHVYGDVPRPTALYEDDGVSFDHENGAANWLELSWTQSGGRVDRRRAYAGRRYEVIAWQRHR